MVCTAVKRRVEQYKLYYIDSKFSTFAALWGHTVIAAIICTLEMQILMTAAEISASMFYHLDDDLWHRPLCFALAPSAKNI